MNGNRQHNPHRGGGQEGHHGSRQNREPGSYGKSQSTPSSSSICKDDVKKIIQDELATKDMVNTAKEFGEFLNTGRDSISTTQLRNAYGSMKKYQMMDWNSSIHGQILLIKPRLAYAAGRHKNKMKNLSDVVGWAIDVIRDEKDFQRFCNFFEAIVAYFKAAGGK